MKTTNFLQLSTCILLLAIIIWNIGATIFAQRNTYLSHNYWQNYNALEKVYYGSVYKNKKGNFLPDETLYSYIGGALMRGKSPIFLNPEVPPLGTYLIGISTVLFNNQHVLILFFAILDLVVLYLLGKQVYSSKITPLLAVSLFSFEPIFKNQLIYTPLLDIIQLSFLLIVFYMFNKFLMQKNNLVKYALVISIFLGFFISTKFFGTGFAVILAIVATLLFEKDFKRLKIFLFSLPISIIVLYSTYIKVLIDGYPFHKFLGIQRWIFWYNQGHITQPFSVWPLLMFNKWYVWFGKIPILSDPQWVYSWPLTTVLSLVTTMYLLIRKTTQKEVYILSFWILAYLSLMSFVQASTRYFVILIPFLYLVSIFGVEKAVIKIFKK